MDNLAGCFCMRAHVLASGDEMMRMILFEIVDYSTILVGMFRMDCYISKLEIHTMRTRKND